MVKQFLLKIFVNLFVWLCGILQESSIDLEKLLQNLSKLQSKIIKTQDILENIKEKVEKEIPNEK